MAWQDHFYIRELQATVRINYDIFRKAPDCMNQAYILDEIESSSSILQGGKVNKNGKKNMSLRCRTIVIEPCLLWVW